MLEDVPTPAQEQSMEVHTKASWTRLVGWGIGTAKGLLAGGTDTAGEAGPLLQLHRVAASTGSQSQGLLQEQAVSASLSNKLLKQDWPLSKGSPKAQGRHGERWRPLFTWNRRVSQLYLQGNRTVIICH